MSITVGKLGSRSSLASPKFSSAMRFKNVKRTLAQQAYPFMPPIPFFDSRPVTFRGKKWPLLGNDRYGCCTFAGIVRIGIARARRAGYDLGISDDAVIAAYLDCTNGIDNGEMPINALSYMRNVGIKRNNGEMYKVTAYARVDDRDTLERRSALSTFDSLYVAAGLPARLDEDRDHRLELTPPNKRTGKDSPRSLGGHAYNVFGAQRREEFVVLWEDDMVEEEAWTDFYREECWVFLDNTKRDEQLLAVMLEELNAIKSV